MDSRLMQQIRQLAAEAEHVLRRLGWRNELHRFDVAMADIEENDPDAAIDLLHDIVNRMDDENLTGTKDEKLMDNLLKFVHQAEAEMKRGGLVQAYREHVAESLTVRDFKDFFEELAENGMNDRKQWEGMLNRAKEIAKQRGKPNDRNTIIGILQGFLGGR